MAAARGRGDGHPRILLNALALRVGGSGVQTYCGELLRALPAAWPDARYAALVASDVVAAVPEGVAARAHTFRVDHGLSRRMRSLRPPRRAELVHGLDTDIPWRTRVPTVATVHDLALFDVPWAFPAASARVKRALVGGAIRRADALIAVSPFTAERVRAHFGRDATVVPEAPRRDATPPTADAIDAVRRRYGLDGRFVLHVGNLEPRKDVRLLASACATAGLPLVLAGGAIRTVDVPVGAHALGYVADEELAALYGAATVVAYVSRYEGFALPPVEAMACGAAVVATSVGALPDVAAGAYEAVPVGDVEGMARALRGVAADADRRAALQAAGRAAAARLSWARAARATVDVYRTLL
jgi:glycosyltransferase involved in cell wall biosynthesis